MDYRFAYVAAVTIAFLVTWRKPAASVGFALGCYVFDAWAVSTVYSVANNPWVTNALVGLLVLFALVCRYGRTFPVQGLSIGSAATHGLFLAVVASAFGSWQAELSFERLVQFTPYYIIYLWFVPALICCKEDLCVAFDTLLVVVTTMIPVILLTCEFADGSFARYLIPANGVVDKENMGGPLTLATAGGFAIILGSISLLANRGGLVSLCAVVAIPSGVLVGIVSGTRGQVMFAVVAVVLAIAIAGLVRPVVLALLAAGPVVLFGIAQWAGVFEGTRWELDEILNDRGTMLRSQLIDFWLRNWEAASWATKIRGIGPFVTGCGLYSVSYPHNIFVEVLVEEGVFGLVLLVLALCCYAHAIWKLCRGKRCHVLASLAACLIFSLLVAQKQGTLLSSENLFMFGLVGCRLAHIGSSTRGRSAVDTPFSERTVGAHRM